MNATLRIGSIGGIPISLHASWLLIYAVITWSLAVGYFPAAIEGLGTAAAWVSGLVAALLLFVSVLLHELSHAFVARASGVEVRGITLHVFGGVSQLEGEPPSPRAEFLIAVVGPLTSFAIAAGLRGLLALDVGGPTSRAVVTYLAFVNAAVGAFNLIPGFPLDGGRLLRAALWWWKGALEPATYLASRVGIVFDRALDGLHEEMMRETDPARLRAQMRAFERRLLDEQAHQIVTLWWHRTVPHHARLRGWKVSPSHYLNQDLANVWLAPE